MLGGWGGVRLAINPSRLLLEGVPRVHFCQGGPGFLSGVEARLGTGQRETRAPARRARCALRPGASSYGLRTPATDAGSRRRQRGAAATGDRGEHPARAACHRFSPGRTARTGRDHRLRRGWRRSHRVEFLPGHAGVQRRYRVRTIPPVSQPGLERLPAGLPDHRGRRRAAAALAR